MTSIIFSTIEKQIVLHQSIQNKTNIRCLFNEGTIIESTCILGLSSSGIHFDAERFKLADFIKTNQPSVFVFYDQTYRYQFFSRNVSIISGKKNLKELLVPFPNSISVMPGRRFERKNITKNNAHIEINHQNSKIIFPINEMSYAGFSFLTEMQMNPFFDLSFIFNASLILDRIDIPCKIKVIRKQPQLYKENSLLVACQIEVEFDEIQKIKEFLSKI